MRTLFKAPYQRLLNPINAHRFDNSYLSLYMANHCKSLAKSRLLIIALTLIPISVQAALPATIQTALNKAELTYDNISVIVTPVGDKNSSRLPPIVRVIDNKSNNNASISKDISATSTSNTQNKEVIVDKQTIEQQERTLNAYTDDPYTYQSLKSTPPILPASNNSATVPQGASTATPVKSVPRISQHPNTARTPASTMKLIPSFVALDTLGANFVWFTRVYHSGIIIGNRLYGDLIIQGSGDPKMTHERLEQMLYQVQKIGIRHIEGNIIVDSAIFNRVSKNPAAFDNAPLRPYNTSPDGFLVNFNSMNITSHPLHNGQAQLTYIPQLADYQLPTLINTRSSVCSNAQYSLEPQWQKDKLTFNAELPDSCGKHIFYVAYPDAKDFATRVVNAKWQALGNTLAGEVIAQETPYVPYNVTKTANHKRPNVALSSLPVSTLPLVSYPSLTLTQQIYDINHFSNNVMTEQVALSISSYNKAFTTKTSATKMSTNKVSTTENSANQASSTKAKAPINNAFATSLYQLNKPNTSNYPQALETINQWWQTNLNTPPPYLTNGSGLCRDCTVTAANLSELLDYAYNHPSFAAYVDSLGVAGVSGTIAYHSQRLPNSAAIGRAWIKTGTLNNVTAMAGYVKGQSGQDYTVVGIINTKQALNPYTARPVLDAMLDWTAQQ